MLRVALKVIIGGLVFAGIMTESRAIQFRGELTGVWTVGVPDFGIDSGDTFQWHYAYESEDINGNFEVGGGAVATIFRSDLSGLEGKMDLWGEGFLTVAGSRITRAGIAYQFDDPREVPSVSLFTLSANHFRGFGEGTISFSDPVRVPDQTSTLACLFLSVGCLWAGRRFLSVS